MDSDINYISENLDYSACKTSSQHLSVALHTAPEDCGNTGCCLTDTNAHKHTHACAISLERHVKHVGIARTRPLVHAHTLSQSHSQQGFSKNHWISSCLSVWKQESLAEEVNDPNRQRTPHWELRMRKSFGWAHPHQLKGNHNKSQPSRNTAKGYYPHHPMTNESGITRQDIIVEMALFMFTLLLFLTQLSCSLYNICIV